jgi:cellulose synthase/poly-beta-1,6-N-acetylglucosamine synthase-like glycosyltransferase
MPGGSQAPPINRTAFRTVPIELSIIMPCLNEAETLETCIRKAMATSSGPESAARS